MMYEDRNSTSAQQDFIQTFDIQHNTQTSWSSRPNDTRCVPLSKAGCTERPAKLEVYRAGKLTVIGFGGGELIDDLNFSEFHDEIMQLISIWRCQTLAVDLTRVRLIPSGLLGVLMSVYHKNVDVLLFNASKDIREVLEITRLNKVLQTYEVEVS
jgi:anti-sigma B factor antagonist